MVSLLRRNRHSRFLGLGLLVATTAQASVAAAADDTDSSAADGSRSAPVAAGSDDGSTPPGDTLSEPPATRKSTKSKDDRGTSHQGQVAIRVAAIGGMHIVMRYDESPYCAEPEPDGEPKKFCGFGSPLGLDTAIGYAPLAGVEPFLWGRFDFSEETKTYTNPLLVLGAGVRLYTMSDAPFKFFIEPAIGAELEKGTSDSPNDSSAYKQDWMFRLAVGPQYDFNRYIGLYGAASMSLGVVRSLSARMELHGGLQARFP